MAHLVRVPHERVPKATLQALLEEYASRDGTDYGERETPLATRVAQLQRCLVEGSIALLYDTGSESWDLLPAPIARDMLRGSDGAGVEVGPGD